MGSGSSTPTETAAAATTTATSTPKEDYNQAIPDQFESYEELQKALRQNGLESSNLIVGIDYTKSNMWTGQTSFQGKCLHTIDSSGFVPNFYQSVMQGIGNTLEPFDDDNWIPAFGFGDTTTTDKSVFPFNPDGKPCKGFKEVLQRYNEITPHVALAGPTNFAPVIHQAIDYVASNKAYHILVIIADGQVTNQQATAQAIVEASKYPLSIIVVGVGDGPWDMMQQCDDTLKSRLFDNFQFVEYNRVLKYNRAKPDLGLAIAALMEIPEQYQRIRKLGLLA